MEIGSEFWVDSITSECNRDFPNWILKYGETVLTSSGRGAISLLLQHIKPENKTVLLPAYICESVIQPFVEQGYSCYFYESDESLTSNIEEIKAYHNMGIFIHMGYYGFSTNSNLLNVIQYLREHSTIIVEDVTHTLFSNFNRFEENDFYLGSIRKWLGVPSGGFLASPNRKLKKPLLINNNFSDLRTKALMLKGQYIKTRDEGLKDDFLSWFSDAETLLDREVTPFGIDGLSIEILNLLNIEDMHNKRRNNFNILLIGLRNVSYLNVLFTKLDKDVCPFFFPIIINSDRNQIRKMLIKEKIYCPIHWPRPGQIDDNISVSTLAIYNNILSIPCDQRYGVKDMERIISVFKAIEGEVSTLEH
jgi:dTDP-4-amino-4,6-dideoxygalactose transaminase